mmetsp:Transcript_1808/g.2525  ORF Transcript_1808/g.2525 Transcript_1808/m.2525 type:complete len:322 (-) Transcript_1808:250-1215(-)
MGRSRHEMCKQNKGLKSRRSRAKCRTKGLIPSGRRNSKTNEGYKRKLLNSIKIDEANSSKVAIVLRKLDGVLVADQMSSLSISADTPSNQPSSSRNAATYTPPNTSWNDLRSPLAPGRITFFPLIVDRDEESVSSNQRVVGSNTNSSFDRATSTMKGSNIDNNNHNNNNNNNNNNNRRSSERSKSFSSFPSSSSIGQKTEYSSSSSRDTSFHSSSSTSRIKTRNSLPPSMSSLFQARSQRRNRPNSEGGRDANGEKVAKITRLGLKRSQSTGTYDLQHHLFFNRSIKTQELTDSDTKAAPPYGPTNDDGGGSREVADEKWR